MHMKHHKNGDISFWFSSDLCVGIKFAGYDTVDYFIRYKDGRWVAQPMTNGSFKKWYYGKSSNLWDTKEYCKVNEFDCDTDAEEVKIYSYSTLVAVVKNGKLYRIWAAIRQRQ